MENSIYYLVREPKTKREKNPLLLLLHGYGSNEEDLFSFASELPDEYYVISARAPYSLGYGSSYAWYAIDFTADEKRFSDLNQARNSREIVSALIDQLVSEYPIDKNEVTLVGFSQGAILSYAVSLSYPQKVKQVAAMSGYLNPEIMVDGFEKNDFGKLRFYISHGSVDQVVPVDWARKSKPFLDGIGIESIYKEYPVGHGVAPQNFFDFRNWLLEK
ncbi:alpha/beta fold hydrolase [Flavobacterium sp. MAH-1]|uniref:Alpha/beta fold hydrolase n=1 Tax=Flavobacterium agri TaxID=2743471 RepID=A0A7Y9C5G9_9FLAO|nr:alpha/beta fold hydrolase [Flavobacterium agri]NUY79324.1 alpha/beta fold hydrolase [Flavobacterium agri]NYA69348.1 alpha/beta fold hydrolase [Flavobacterium agri]